MDRQTKQAGQAILPPGSGRETLRDVPVQDICGISEGIASPLELNEATTCGKVVVLLITVLPGRWDNIGGWLWQVCDGYDPALLVLDAPSPQTMRHGKVMLPDTKYTKTIEIFMCHMAEKVTARLPRHDYVAGTCGIGLWPLMGWVGGAYRTVPCNDSREIMRLGREMMRIRWLGNSVFHIHINVFDPKSAVAQGDRSQPATGCKGAINQAMDAINRRYSEFTLSPAPLLEHSEMPNVISPAWKPFGHRETIRSGGYGKAPASHCDIAPDISGLPGVG